MKIEKHHLIDKNGQWVEVPGPAYVVGFGYDSGMAVVWIATTPGGPIGAKLFRVYDMTMDSPSPAEGVFYGSAVHMGQGRFLYEMNPASAAPAQKKADLPPAHPYEVVALYERPDGVSLLRVLGDPQSAGTVTKDTIPGTATEPAKFRIVIEIPAAKHLRSRDPEG